MPLVTVVTPSSLAVFPDVLSESNLDMVPIINFSSFLAQATPDVVTPSTSKLASFVTSGGALAPIPIFLPNASYHVQFTGPSLLCQEPEERTKSMIDQAFEELAGLSSGSENNAVYMALSPNTGQYGAWPLEVNGTVRSDNLSFTSFLDACVKGSGANCAFADPTLNGVPTSSPNGRTGVINTSNALWMRLGINRLSCSIQKTQYDVVFDSRNPLSSLKDYNFSLHGAFDRHSSTDSYGHIVLTQSLLNILVGSLYFSPQWCCSNRMDRCITAAFYTQDKTAAHRTALSSYILPETNATWERIYRSVEADITKCGAGILNPPTDKVPFGMDVTDLAATETPGEMIEQMSRNLTLSVFSQEHNLSVPPPTPLHVLCTDLSYQYTRHLQH